MLHHMNRAAAGLAGYTSSITYITSVILQQASSPTANYTFAATSLGPYYPNRRTVLVAGMTLQNGSTAIISSLTVNGVFATERLQTGIASANALRGGIYDISVTGTTADIGFNFTTVSGAIASSRIIHIYSMYSFFTSTSIGSDAASPFEFGYTYSKNNIYVGLGRCLSTATETWSNVSQSIGTTASGNSRFSAATVIPGNATTTVTYTPTSTSSAFMGSVVYV